MKRDVALVHFRQLEFPHFNGFSAIIVCSFFKKKKYRRFSFPIILRLLSFLWISLINREEHSLFSTAIFRWEKKSWMRSLFGKFYRSSMASQKCWEKNFPYGNAISQFFKFCFIRFFFVSPELSLSSLNRISQTFYFIFFFFIFRFLSNRKLLRISCFNQRKYYLKILLATKLKF